MKEKFIEGCRYVYDGIEAYCFKPNRLVLKDGRLVRRSSGMYSPDVVTLGSKDRHGYLRVRIDGKMVGVHRLVAQHFIENPDNLPVVDHINENKACNRVDNLRWITLEDNTSRTNIRDNRALNEAKEVLAKVKEVEKGIDDKIAYNEALKETIRLSLEEESHVVEVFKTKTEEWIKKYEDKIDKLLAAGEVAAHRKYKKTLPALHKKLTKQEEFIASTGKPIKISGKVYRSVRSGADFIYRDQAKLGNVRNLQTIRTELRKIYKGLTSTTLMYGEYKIEMLVE